MLPQSHNFVVIDLWFKIFPRCETCTVIRTNSSVLHPPFGSFSAPVSSPSVLLSHIHLLHPFLLSASVPATPTDKTSSFAPFLTPSPIPCHLYTIFLVIANIHLRRAPSISRYPNPRAHPCTLHPRRASVVHPSSAYAPSTEARRPLLLIYDGYLQDHAERVKTFYNCATPCVVLLLLAITPSHSEMFLKVSSGIGRWPGVGEEAAANRPRLLLKTCRAVIIRSAFTPLSYYVPQCMNLRVHIVFENIIIFMKSSFQNDKNVIRALSPYSAWNFVFRINTELNNCNKYLLWCVLKYKQRNNKNVKNWNIY